MKLKEQKITEKIEDLVIDTSVIIEGLISEKIKSKEIKPKRILIHEAVIAELENQANNGKEKGYMGLEEIKNLRELAKKFDIEIAYAGKRPTEFEIKRARSGEIDALIRELAYEEKAHFITADRVNSLAAQAKGIKTILVEFEKEERALMFEKYFDASTMSLHIKEGTKPVAKRGMPGNWKLVEVDEILDTKTVETMAKQIVEEATRRKDSSIELDRDGSTIIQLGHFRTVIVRPKLSDGWEITLVRPVKRLSLNDYKLSEKLRLRLDGKAEGVLIAGAPGMGKSTFTQALTEHYAKQNKIIKTVEAPRDLIVPDNVTQYAIGLGTPEEIHDILLLSRPDYTIFDEMRNTDDFALYSDLRLAGVGMVGVIHATKPIDAIQRFIGKIEMGVIPHVVDTVLFIQNGNVAKTFAVKMEVKVPAGMTEADLARPCVVIEDFETGKQEYEVYSYGNDTVVVPVTEVANKESPIRELAKIAIEREFQKYADEVEVRIDTDNKITLFVPEHDIAAIIGKQGKNIEMLEKMIGMSIDVQELTSKAKKRKFGEPVEFTYELNRNVVLKVAPEYAGRNVSIYIKDDLLMTANVGKSGDIRIGAEHRLGKALKQALQRKDLVEVRL